MEDNAAKSFLDPILVSLMKKEVDKSKKADEPVNRAFRVIAEKSGLKFNTVRNYYYRYIHEKSRDQEIHEEKQGNEKSGSEVAGTTFTLACVEKLMKTMLIGQAQGKSVRGCANELGQGDKKMMLRYQNKYRNLVSGNPEFVKRLMKGMSDEGLIYYDPFKKQIIDGKDISTEGDMFASLGQLFSNIDEIDSQNLDGFLKGILELSHMALMYKRQVKGRNKVDILDDYQRLTTINMDFLRLTPSGKLTALSKYIKELGECIGQMEGLGDSRIW